MKRNHRSLEKMMNQSNAVLETSEIEKLSFPHALNFKWLLHQMAVTSRPLAFLKSIKQVFNAKVSHNAKVLLIFKIFAFKLPPN